MEGLGKDRLSIGKIGDMRLDRCQFQRQAALIREFFQIPSRPGRFDLIGVGDSLLQSAVGLHDLSRCFFAYGRNAGNIIGRVSHQGLHLQKAVGSNAIGLLDILRAVDLDFTAVFLGFRQANGDLIIHQLEQVPVAA